MFVLETSGQQCLQYAYTVHETSDSALIIILYPNVFAQSLVSECWGVWTFFTRSIVAHHPPTSQSYP